MTTLNRLTAIVPVALMLSGIGMAQTTPPAANGPQQKARPRLLVRRARRIRLPYSGSPASKSFTASARRNWISFVYAGWQAPKDGNRAN